MCGSFVLNLCLKLQVLEGEFLLSFGHWGFADLGGGFSPQNLPRLALPVLYRCFLPFLCLHECEVGKIGLCRSAVGSHLGKRRQKFLSKPPPGADEFQFYSIVIFSQEFRICQRRCSLWYKKRQILIILKSNSVTTSRSLVAVLDYSSSFGASSFKNLNDEYPRNKTEDNLIGLLDFPPSLVPWINRYFLRHNTLIFHICIFYPEKVLLSQCWCAAEGGEYLTLSAWCWQSFEENLQLYCLCPAVSRINNDVQGN